MASWQSRLATYLIRTIFKRRPPGDLEKAVHMMRRRLRERRWLPKRIAPGVTIRPIADGEVRGEWIEPQSGVTRGVLYYLHGGGYVACSPATHRPLTSWLTKLLGSRTFALDYRLAPEHRFPAALEDAIAGYRWLRSQGIAAGEIVVAGDSAGGGLTLALLIALRDRDEELPAAAACLSPWTDLAGTGESIDLNEYCDPMFYADVIRNGSRIYLGDESPQNPLASPLYASLEGLPPLLIHASSSEVLRDDSTRLAARAEAAGVEVELKIWQDLPHVWQIMVKLLPEAEASLREIAAFFSRHLSREPRSETGETADLAGARR